MSTRSADFVLRLRKAGVDKPTTEALMELASLHDPVIRAALTSWLNHRPDAPVALILASCLVQHAKYLAEVIKTATEQLRSSLPPVVMQQDNHFKQEERCRKNGKSHRPR